MALAPSPASIPSHLTAAPLMLPWDLRLTPEQFERVCQANPEAVLELAADGQLISLIPTGGETGARCLRLGQRLLPLGRWARCRCLDRLRQLHRLPACRWLRTQPRSTSRLPSPLPRSGGGFASTSGASPSDEGPRGITALRHKMDIYQANGASLGWLLLPHERAVEIWRGGQRGRAERLENTSRLEGGELAAGLALNLQEIWAI